MAIGQIMDGLEFKRTCCACPEQYDVYKDGEQVGYVRLRFGGLTCDYPDVDGDTIFDCDYGHAWCGEFENNEDRVNYLTKIAKELNKWLAKRSD